VRHARKGRAEKVRGVSKRERFSREEIYVDYPFEEVMIRWPPQRVL